MRTAVGAFCSLTRPSRLDMEQLDALALPLFDALTLETRRYLGAALSECELAPPRLIARLAADAIEVAAPVLARSAVVEPGKLAAIATRGAGHRAAVLARDDLDPALRSALEKQAGPVDASAPAQETEPAVRIGENAERIRDRLRAMMLAPSGRPRDHAARHALLRDHDAAPDVYARLREPALTGVPALFQAALAEALDIDRGRARAIFTTGYFDLLAALRALDLAAEQAYVLTAAAYPALFGHAEAIRLFLERFERLDLEDALDRVRAWRAEAIGATVGIRPLPRAEEAQARLKAS